MTYKEPAVPDQVPSVAVLAEGQVVGETIALALDSAQFAVESFHYPRARSELLETRRKVTERRAEVGIVVAEIDDVAQWRGVVGIIETIPARWIVVTGSSNLTRWGGLIAAGCHGVVSMSTDIERLDQVVRSVAAGGPGMSPDDREQALQAWEAIGPARRELMKRIAALSRREWEVLGMLNDGQSITTIAAAGGVSEGTVRSQVRAIRQKLNVKSQLAAVASYQEALEFDRV
ncbi:helix-turn-helix transcriptional regulator [Nocardioides gilvus]|uniref:helix-turn-helix transcriptional regulator n=1 Tax=Nocardioides gilvus TaxID=1735589 RepID=UPI000D747E07|nr:LuxR C-terminal-related transcriptional regulator [Nocardioides gilvus]